MVAKIDPEDALRCAAHKWSANETSPGRFYAQARTDDGGNLYLHRFVIEAPEGVLTDHRNGDTLDCRKINLRLATPGQNTCNRRGRTSQTGYRGVTLRRGFRYQAKIKHKHRFLHIGYFDTPEDAARAYDATAADLHGEFAVLNFPFPASD